MANYFVFSKEYSSLDAIAYAYGISGGHLFRLRRRFPEKSLEDLIKDSLQNSQIQYEGVTYTNLTELVESQGKDLHVVVQRLYSLGWTLHEALTKPLRTRTHSKTVEDLTVFDKTYSTFAEACKDERLLSFASGSLLCPLTSLKLRIQLRALMEYEPKEFLPCRIPYAYVRGLGSLKTAYDMSKATTGRFQTVSAISRKEVLSIAFGKFGKDNVLYCRDFMRYAAKQLESGTVFEALSLADIHLEYVREFIRCNPDKGYLFTNYVNLQDIS